MYTCIYTHTAIKYAQYTIMTDHEHEELDTCIHVYMHASMSECVDDLSASHTHTYTRTKHAHTRMIYDLGLHFNACQSLWSEQPHKHTKVCYITLVCTLVPADRADPNSLSSATGKPAGYARRRERKRNTGNREPERERVGKGHSEARKTRRKHAMYSVHLYICMEVCVYLYNSTRVYICIYKYIYHVRITINHVYVYIYIHIYMCVYINLSMPVHIYIHVCLYFDNEYTYIHTNMCYGPAISNNER